MQNLSWRKPSGSGGGRQNRVEVAELPTSSAVRESQPPTARIWPFPLEWQTFLCQVESQCR